jgi:hypothetical protein
MLTKEEIKQLRLKFWLEFDNYSLQKKKKARKPLKWIMNNTGIKQLKLKFDFDDQRAIVGIDVETRNIEKRIDIFCKLELLKPELEHALKQELTWEVEYILPTGKSISRACLETVGVSIYRMEDWPVVMDFFYKNMVILEKIFEAHKESLKYNENDD